MAAVPLLLLCLAGAAHGQRNLAQRQLLPAGLSVVEGFEPGFGSPVGEFQSVEGQVIVAHRDAARGFRADQGKPLFLGDAIYTLEEGKAQLRLGDGSVISMGSAANLVITRAIYDPEKGNRSSFLRSGWGRIRFFVRKLMEFKLSEFEVKTNTAVAGVRGSDFVVESTVVPCSDLPQVPESLRRSGEMCGLTEVTALENTRLEVASVATPELAPVVVTDFQQTRVAQAAAPTEPERVPTERIEQLKEELKITAQVVPQEEEQKRDTKKVQKAEVKEGEKAPQAAAAGPETAPAAAGEAPGAAPAEGDETDAVSQDAARPAPQGLAGPDVPPVEAFEVLVPEEELVPPEDVIDMGGLEEQVIDEIIETQIINRNEEQATDEQQQASEEQIEEEIRELPGFPGTPQ